MGPELTGGLRAGTVQVQFVVIIIVVVLVVVVDIEYLLATTTLCATLRALAIVQAARFYMNKEKESRWMRFGAVPTGRRQTGGLPRRRLRGYTANEAVPAATAVINDDNNRRQYCNRC